MNADIVGFQEIFEEAPLLDCIAGTPYEGWHFRAANPEGKRPVNGILSKFPIVHHEVITDIPLSFNFFDDNEMELINETSPISIPIKRFSRAVLKAEIKITEQISVVVFVLHLKSKRPILSKNLDNDDASYTEVAIGKTRSLLRRAIEASGVRELVSQVIEAEPHKPILLIGDLNDSGNSVTNDAMLGEPPYFRLPLEQRIKKWKYVLHNCKDIQARKSLDNFHYTYIHNGHYESLDNIFVSNHFADLNNDKTGRVIDVKLYNDHIIDTTISRSRKPIHVYPIMGKCWLM